MLGGTPLSLHQVLLHQERLAFSLPVPILVKHWGTEKVTDGAIDRGTPGRVRSQATAMVAQVLIVIRFDAQ